MEGLRSGGRTVLFVSHNMAAVENLCARALWIDSGQLRMDGNAKDVIKGYLGSYASDEQSGQELQVESRTGTGEVRFTSVELLDPDGAASPIIQSGDGLVVRMHYRAECYVHHPSFTVRLFTSMGTLITEASTWLQGVTIPSIGPGEGYVELEIGALNLIPGRYGLTFSVKALMVPPLPAASRPSKMMITFSFSALTHSWSWQSSTWSFSSSFS